MNENFKKAANDYVAACLLEGLIPSKAGIWAAAYCHSIPHRAKPMGERQSEKSQ
jgi:hypothetical protein